MIRCSLLLICALVSLCAIVRSAEAHNVPLNVTLPAGLSFVNAVVDLQPVAAHWHATGANYDPSFDVDGDGAITVRDLMLLAGSANTRLSSDPYHNTTSQHATQIEPDTFSFGSTIVAAVQTGRFFGGGSSNICWATSTNSGTSWTNGCLPGITKYQDVGPYDRVSDPSVAYDAAHNVWMISTLPMFETPAVHGAAILTSRSTDGGLTWSNPVTVKTGANLDKNWIACDNTPTSPFYGRCYTEWDDHAAGNVIQMSTSADGGLTWGAALSTADSATGLGGQPVVRPDGTVIVPIGNFNETAILSFISTDGGASWGSTITIANAFSHQVAGNLGTNSLPSAEIDGAGKVYVVWMDCRFRSSCAGNDIVMSTSTNGISWSPVVRIPIGTTNDGSDRFLPGLAVDRNTSGSTAKLALAYYYYPTANCSASTCQLNVGYVSSVTGGSSWSAAIKLAGPMMLSWLPNTGRGRLVGDYISTSFAGGTAHPVFIVAHVPAAGGTDCATATPNCDQAMYSPSGGLFSGTMVSTTGIDQPVPGVASDHVIPQAPITHR